MITKRIGNDIPIEWTIIRCGEPEDLVGKRFSLYLYSFAGKVEIEDYVVSGNRIRFVFQGAQQIYAGIYGLLLVENEGEDDMYTIDHCQAFKLISHGCGECECSDGVTVTSDIAIPANGLSAYQIALKNGYVGTEEEWLESLKADSDSSEKIKEHNESESAHPFLKGLIDGKVDRKSGYGLSKNDFTDLLKAKLEGLQNYDDSEVRSLVAEIQKELDTLVEGDTQGVIDSFNEMEAFLQGITETETLTGLLEQLKTSLEEQISQKVDKEAGKGLSSNDYTDEEKVKLAGLENYDDTEVRGQIEKNKSDILEHDSQIEELRSTKQSVFKTNGLTEFISGLDNNIGHQMSDGEIESIFGSAENLRSLIHDRPIIEDTFSASGISTYIPLQLVSGLDEGVEGVVYEGNNVALTSNWDDPFFVNLYSNAGVYYISRLKSHIYVLPGDIDTLTKYSPSNDIKKVLGDIDELMERIDEYTGLLLIYNYPKSTTPKSSATLLRATYFNSQRLVIDSHTKEYTFDVTDRTSPTVISVIALADTENIDCDAGSIKISSALNYLYPRATGVGRIDSASDGTGEIFNDYTGNNSAKGKFSHAEGNSTKASGVGSHAEGAGTEATGDYSHAEGNNSIASGSRSHAEGLSTQAEGMHSHAEGYLTRAVGDSSHAEGVSTYAEGSYSHAEGYHTSAKGKSSHASGYYTFVENDYGFAVGKYNYEYNYEYGSTKFSVGIGTSESDRHNAFEVRGNSCYMKGVGGYEGRESGRSVNSIINEMESSIVGLSTSESLHTFALKDYILENRNAQPGERITISKVEESDIFWLINDRPTPIINAIKQCARIKDGYIRLYEKDEMTVFPNVGSRYDPETGRYIGYYSLKDAFASDETFPFDYMSLDITNDESDLIYITFYPKKKEGSAPVSVNVPELTEDYTVPANATGTEHIYYITIGATVHSVTAAEGVKWLGGEAPEPEAGTTLVISVINNLAVWGTF